MSVPMGGPPPSWPVTTAASKPRRTRLALGVLVAGLLMVVPAGVKLGPEFVRAVSGSTITVPGSVTRHLSPGTYAVYEHTGTGTSAGPVNFGTDRGTTIDPEQVRVTDPAGQPLAVEWFGNASTSETIRRNNDVYTAVVQFRVETTNDYLVSFTTGPGDVIVGRTLGSQFRRAAPAIALAGLGGLTTLLGIVLLIVLVARRPKGAVATAVPMYAPGPSPAAAWYPDPEQPGRQRYWDGYRWTDHRA